MRTLPLSLILAVGCGGGDPDNDGLSNAEEAALGTDPKTADSDGDGIDDGDEVELGTDPQAFDSDDDGVADGEEIALGTDPTSADSDGDGIPDGDELASGDPLDPFLWPDDRWPDFSANAEITNGGYGFGDQMPNFQFYDQFDQEVDLHQFYGMVVLLDLSAGWCIPCRDLAEEAQEHYEEERDRGFVVIHLMVQNNFSNEPGLNFLQSWADEYGLTFPVVRQPGNGVESALFEAGTHEGFIPFQIVLDREMRIDMAFSGVPNVPVVNRVTELLQD